MLIDRANVLSGIAGRGRVALELGCGPRKRRPDSIGIDLLDYPGVDLVGDVFEALAGFPDASVDSVLSLHFFEHVDDLGRLVDEVQRVLRPGGDLEVVVPHFSNPYFHSDPTHRRTFGLYTFSYFARDELLRRKVPNYGRDVRLELVSVDLCFKSFRPRLVRHAMKRAWGALFNSCTFLQELYEETLTGIVSCYEVRYVLRRLP